MLAIPILVDLVLVLVAIALAMGVKYFAQMLGHAVGSGGWVSAIANFLTGGFVTRAENAISHWAGRIVSGIDATIGTAFHALALTVDRVGSTLRLTGTFAATAAHAIGGAVSHAHLMTIVRDIRHEISALGHATDVAIKHALSAGRALAHDVVHPFLHRLKQLEHTVNHTLRKEVAHALKLAQKVETEVGSIPNLLQALGIPVGITAFSGAVAWALSQVGLGNLNCDRLKQLNRDRGCSTWGALDDLLLLATALLAAEDFAALVHEMQKLEVEATDAFKALVNLP